MEKEILKDDLILEKEELSRVLGGNTDMSILSENNEDDSFDFANGCSGKCTKSCTPGCSSGCEGGCMQSSGKTGFPVYDV